MVSKLAYDAHPHPGSNITRVIQLTITTLFVHATFRCGPCQFIAPAYERLSNKYLQVVFLKVDVDDCDQVAAANNVRISKRHSNLQESYLSTNTPSS